jgi:precorrin-3B C17-methyltransferase
MSADSKKELYIVGLGPGARQKMTQEAIDVVEACEVIAGYKVYIDLLKPYYPDKEYLVNGMRQEVERCRLALETAAGGKKTEKNGI